MAETITSLRETAIVTGGSRGLGRGIAETLSTAKMRVVVVARDPAKLEAAAKEMGVGHVAADVADELTAGRLLQDLRPDLLVLCAGASPLLRPLHLHSWETFSHNWEVDAKATFVWVRNALLLPMKPGGHIVIVSSMAAVNGSPLSGGYAGAKRMQWFMADYAAQEAGRLKIGLRVHCLLPVLNPSADLGRAAIAAYAERANVGVEQFTQRLMPALTPSIIGDAVADLHLNPGKWDQLTYRIGGAGLAPVS